MAHTTSDELPNDSLQASTGESVHPNGFPFPKLTPKQWGIALGGSLRLVGAFGECGNLPKCRPPLR